MDDNGVLMCPVCEEQMKPKTQSIAWISCQKYVHLKTYTRILYQEAKKFNGSKCLMSEIVHWKNMDAWNNKKMWLLCWLALFQKFVIFIF